jgi:hypothetical protein
MVGIGRWIFSTIRGSGSTVTRGPERIHKLTFTLSGPVLLLLIAYVFLRKPRTLAYMVLFFAPFSATAIVNFGGLGYKSGGLGLTPAMLCTVLFFVSQLLFGLAFRPVAISLACRIQIGLIALFAAVFLLSLGVNATNGVLTAYQVTQSVYVLIGLTTVVLFALEFATQSAIYRAVRWLRASAIFVSLWGIVQFLCFNLGIPYPSVLFNNSQSDAADMFDQVGPGFIRIASVAVEPSFFASSLLHFISFGATIIIIEPRLRNRYWVWPVLLATGVLLLSTSSTGYFGLIVLFGLLLLRRPLLTLAIGIPAGLAGSLALLLIPKAASVLASMTIDKSETSSYLERTAGAVRALNTFLASPILGHGWGSVEAFNAVTATLANVGLIGAFVFGLAGAATLFELQPRRSLGRNGPEWRLTAYGTGIQHALIVALAVSVSSGIHYVVADDWCFWALGVAVASCRQLPVRMVNVGARSAVLSTASFANSVAT